MESLNKKTMPNIWQRIICFLGALITSFAGAIAFEADLNGIVGFFFATVLLCVAFWPKPE